MCLGVRSIFYVLIVFRTEETEITVPIAIESLIPLLALRNLPALSLLFLLLSLSIKFIELHFSKRLFLSYTLFMRQNALHITSFIAAGLTATTIITTTRKGCILSYRHLG